MFEIFCQTCLLHASHISKCKTRCGFTYCKRILGVGFVKLHESDVQCVRVGKSVCLWLLKSSCGIPVSYLLSVHLCLRAQNVVTYGYLTWGR